MAKLQQLGCSQPGRPLPSLSLPETRLSLPERRSWPRLSHCRALRDACAQLGPHRPPNHASGRPTTSSGDRSVFEQLTDSTDESARRIPFKKLARSFIALRSTDCAQPIATRSYRQSATVAAALRCRVRVHPGPLCRTQLKPAWRQSSCARRQAIARSPALGGGTTSSRATS